VSKTILNIKLICLENKKEQKENRIKKETNTIKIKL
tara:strand:- start:4105 stop:4212 length:108 start_codon:yes stop_codon:yes gene_type:complete